MSLTSRVNMYFLAAMAVVLCACSVVFYGVTSAHVEQQFASELQGVLNALVAAAEVEETEVKWQPLEHSINFDSQDEFGEVHWGVVGDGGLIVEQSRSSNKASSQDQLHQWIELADLDGNTIRDTSDGWAVVARRLSAPRPDRRERELDEFDQLTIVAARWTAPRDAILFRLTLLVTLLPLLAWIVAALLGRLVVRRALRPVTDMAVQTQTFTGTDFQSRLRYRDSGDELAELGGAFNRLLDRQQAAFEQQRRFAGDAAHELRTPLTVLLGEIDVTLRRPRSETEYQSNLRSLRGQTQRLQEIVESLLFLARKEDEATDLTLQTISIAAWLSEHATTWSSLPRLADIQLQNQLAESVHVRATSSLLGHIIDNLVSNALKYSPEGTPVTVQSVDDDAYCVIRVSDTGAGISAGDQQHLCDPFFRSDAARQKGIAGNGLGLAIAHRISMILGGSLEVQSELGCGSCFELRLPISG